MKNKKSVQMEEINKKLWLKNPGKDQERNQKQKTGACPLGKNTA